MNEPDPSFDEVKLTAYALGELDETERAVIEAWLRENPGAHATVAAIRGTAVQLEKALADEPVPQEKVSEAGGSRSQGKGGLLAFPRLYFVIGTLAAACFAVLVVRHEPKPRPEEVTTRYVEMELPPWPETTPASRPAPDAQEEVGATAGFDEEAMRADLRAKAAEGRLAAIVPAEGTLTLTGGVFVRTTEHPVSELPLRVRPDALEEIRRDLLAGRLPAPEKVKIETMLNAFPDSVPPAAPGELFALTLEVAGTPWADGHRLIRVALATPRSIQPIAPILATEMEVRVRFDPSQVREYRLLGYEAAGAGSAREEVRAGLAVNALYEIVPETGDEPGPVLTLVMTGREEKNGAALRVERSLHDVGTTFAESGEDFRWLAAVAAFGEWLRGGGRAGLPALRETIGWAEAAKGEDSSGRRAQFIQLMRLAAAAR